MDGIWMAGSIFKPAAHFKKANKSASGFFQRAIRPYLHIIFLRET
jgi:hypothetical protein